MRQYLSKARRSSVPPRTTACEVPCVRQSRGIDETDDSRIRYLGDDVEAGTAIHGELAKAPGPVKVL